MFDWVNDWRKQPENIYIHLMLLIAIGIDDLFGSVMDAIAANTSGIAPIQHAPVKTFGV